MVRLVVAAAVAAASFASFAGEEVSPEEERLAEIAEQIRDLVNERKQIKRTMEENAGRDFNPELKKYMSFSSAADVRRRKLTAPVPKLAPGAKPTTAAGRLRQYSEAKRYVVARDFDTVPGHVITTWYRNGRPDWKMPAVETQKVERVVGRRIESAFEKARDAAVAGMAAMSNMYVSAVADLASMSNRVSALRADLSTATNRVAALEAWKAGREERSAAAKQEIQDSKLLTTTLKNWLVGIIDRISGGDE